MDPVVGIAGENQRFIQHAREEREWVDLAGDLDQVRVTGVVPGAGEHAVSLQPENLGVGVHARGQRSRNADVGVDFEERIAHRGRC